MTAKVAVAVIHGIAPQRRTRPAASEDLSFSEGLYRKLRRQLGRKVLAEDIVWREIFWADILQDRQERFLRETRRSTDFRKIRQFIVKGIADAAAFQPRPVDDNTAYDMVQDRVSETMKDLDAATPDGTPLVILAHSFGGWIISNYVWDIQHRGLECGNDFQSLATTAKFITFGSNIPLFTFAYAPEDVVPIAFPGKALHPGHELGGAWWLNFYDRDDVLGFPIAPIGPRYQDLADRGELRDVEINAGGLFSAWNPLSHERYWTDRDFVRPVADVLKTLIGKVESAG